MRGHYDIFFLPPRTFHFDHIRANVEASYRDSEIYPS